MENPVTSHIVYNTAGGKQSKSSLTIGVIAAMEEEVAQLKSLAPAWDSRTIRNTEFLKADQLIAQELTGSSSTIDRDPAADRPIRSVELVLVRCGVGKVLAAMVAERLIANFGPDYLLVTGIAGALNPDYRIGDVVISHDTIQHDLDGHALGFPRGTIPFTEIRELRASPELLRIAQRGADCLNAVRLPGDLEEIEHELHVGRILSGDQFITHRELISHRYLVEELAGDAVEMEGASVATVCHLNEVPFLIIRSISDRADGSATIDFQRFMHVAAANSRKVVAHIVKSLQIG